MIEIKNCKGNEQDNIWRIGVNNKILTNYQIIIIIKKVWI